MLNGLPGHIVEISDDRPIASIERWLESKHLKPAVDYVYMGHKDQKEVFGFKDKDNAVMFKLTWGGE